MNCYKCGCSLSEKEFCTNCGTDVTRYKEVMYLSNYFYNEGLEKAKIRDLTGAISSLNQSLKLNKKNINARNLLGLIYFEIGETVSALTEWVISKSYQAEKNIADDYITKVQSNPALLEKMDNAVHKYNMALDYCQQGIYDMPAIQLRKVVQTNPKLLCARLLLALLYIQSEKWTQAREQLEICKSIDIGNTTVNRYLHEVDEACGLEDSKNIGKKRTENAITLQSGNDTIIQPVNRKEPAALHLFLNVLIGLIIGLAIGWFLLAPLRMNMENNSMSKELEDVREQLAIKTASLEDLEAELNRTNADKDLLQADLEAYEGNFGVNDANKNLMLAATEYNKGASMDKALIAEYLDSIDIEFVENSATEEFLALYNTIKASVGPSISATYYNSGYEALRNLDYLVAINDLSKAVYYDENNAEALYALANAYRENKDDENARATYVLVTERFPESEKALKAQAYIAEIDMR